jgi:hypothetical protein
MMDTVVAGAARPRRPRCEPHALTIATKAQLAHRPPCVGPMANGVDPLRVRYKIRWLGLLGVILFIRPLASGVSCGWGCVRCSLHPPTRFTVERERVFSLSLYRLSLNRLSLSLFSYSGDRLQDRQIPGSC